MQINQRLGRSGRRKHVLPNVRRQGQIQSIQKAGRRDVQDVSSLKFVSAPLRQLCGCYYRYCGYHAAARGRGAEIHDQDRVCLVDIADISLLVHSTSALGITSTAILTRYHPQRRRHGIAPPNGQDDSASPPICPCSRRSNSAGPLRIHRGAATTHGTSLRRADYPAR